MTRRKSTHAVFDPENRLAYRSRHLWDCIEFLDSIGVTTYILRCGALTGQEQVGQVTVTKE